MNNSKISQFGIYVLLLVNFTLIYTACKIQNNTATFSGKLVDENWNPIPGHIVTLYPIEMSENGSAIYLPIMNIAASPDFLTAKTDNNGEFTFKGPIKSGMKRMGLIPSKLLENILKGELQDPTYKMEYELVSVKIGPVTINKSHGGSGLTTFSLQTEKNITDVIITARANMWIEGKIRFANKKPLGDADVLFKVQSRLTDKTGGSKYNDQFHKTDKKGNFRFDLFYHDQSKYYKVSVAYQGLTTTSKEFLIHGGSHYKDLVLSLNGNISDIPEKPAPVQQPLFPGMLPLPRETTPEEWIINPENGHAYVRIICESIEAARAQASTERAYLVAINDESEQKWLSGVFGNELYWIGLQKTEEDAEWQWSNGDSLTYTYWGPKDRFQPEYITGSGKTAAVMTFVEGEWHAIASEDLFWNVTKWAILEKDNLHLSKTGENR